MGVRLLREYTREAGISARYKRPIKNRLTPNQLRDMEADLSRFQYSTDAWLKAKGALSETGAVIVTNYKRARYTSEYAKAVEPTDCDPILYEQLLEDLEQYRGWTSRKEFAVQKRLEAHSSQP